MGRNTKKILNKKMFIFIFGLHRQKHVKMRVLKSQKRTLFKMTGKKIYKFLNRQFFDKQDF